MRTRLDENLSRRLGVRRPPLKTEGTGFKVRELVKNYLAYGWSPEELAWQHPPLTLAQVLAVLAYYYEHEEALNEEIRQGLELIDRMRAESKDSPVLTKLRSLHRI